MVARPEESRMSIRALIREFGCDHPYCLAKIRVNTGSLDYGTNYEKECQDIMKRGWAVIGFQHYCKPHKIFHNWGSMMTAKAVGQ